MSDSLDLRRRLISFDFYRSFGGGLSEAVFLRFAPSAAAFLDSRTRGRLRNFSSLPAEAGLAFAALVDLWALREAGVAGGSGSGIGSGGGSGLGDGLSSGVGSAVDSAVDSGSAGGGDSGVGFAGGSGDDSAVGEVADVGNVGGGDVVVGGEVGAVGDAVGGVVGVAVAGGGRLKSRSLSCGEVSESASFDVLSYDEIIAEREALLWDFLFDCRDTFGVPLLYLG